AGQVQGNLARRPGGERHRVLKALRRRPRSRASRPMAVFTTPVRLPYYPLCGSPTGFPMRQLILAAAFALAFATTALAAEPPFYGPQLEGFAYPHPVERFAFESQRQPLSMAYMDVAPTVEHNGRTVVLLHGKNFCAA